MNLSEVKTSEYNDFYNRYINLLPKDLDLINGYITGKKTIIQFLKSIPKEKLNYKYQPKKWTVKEVIQHIIDTERILIYRCFRIAREDKTPLSSFEENFYVKPSGANNKSILELINEYETSRNNSITLIKSLSDENLKFVGIASNSPLSARAASFITLGHEIWHINMIKEKYLNS